MSKMKQRPPGKRPKGRSGGAGRGVKNDAPTCRGTSFRSSIADGQLAPSEECPINQKKRQAGVA